jgi:3-deoxy-manno-octulosonate cytidylyltransferase (CMP-KDO synthetase)
VFRVVIPARFGSTRLPGKPLQPLRGKPLLQWAHGIGLASGAAEVIIATDDERILAVARGFGARACMTSPAHPSGTDRIAEVAVQAGWASDDVVVDLQGDWPLVPAVLVGQVAALLQRHPAAAIATLATGITTVDELLHPAVVKVVTDFEGRALYFSRAPIPWGRDSAGATLMSQLSCTGARRHVGLYAYRVATLRRLSMLPPGQLEQIEKLEQLRALENGMEIRVADAVADPGPAVDTAQDLARVMELVNTVEDWQR